MTEYVWYDAIHDIVYIGLSDWCLYEDRHFLICLGEL
jgi:hypothetical protein